MNRTKGSLPDPYGDKIPSRQLQSVLDRVRKNSPLLNLYDGRADTELDLLAFYLKNSDVYLVADLVPGISGGGPVKRGFLGRAQYFEGGLHHRVSFHCEISREIRYEGYPALEIRAWQPVKRVSNLFVTFPTEERPVILEIPVAGAPPEVRVIEASSKHLKAFIPNSSRLFPKKQRINGFLTQLVDIGELQLNGKLSAGEEDEVLVELDPMKGNTKSSFNRYLETEFELQHHPGKEEKTGDPQTSKAKPTETDNNTSKPATNQQKKAIVIHSSQSIREEVAEILTAMGYACTPLESFSSAISKKTLTGCSLLVLEHRQNEIHATAFLKALLERELILPSRFVILGSTSTDSGQEHWTGLGQGLFLRDNLPQEWMKKKLATWLQATPRNTRQFAEDRGAPLILVADDDPEFTHLMVDILTRNGFRHITASNGDETIKAAKSHLPRLILLDVDMPKRSGIQALQTIKAFRSMRAIPVIMLTGRQDRETVKKALELGVVDYMVKPFEESDLIERIRNTLKAATVKA
ncbi:response regulator [bacterium]|nr:response regulator [bacterium]